MKFKQLFLAFFLVYGITSCDKANKSSTASGSQESGTASSALITAKELNAKNKDIVLIDVRTPNEFKSGHIENAVNIDIYSDEFKQKLSGLDKNTAVYVYCKKGGRSAKAARTMIDMGFQEVYDLDGGMRSWEKQNLKVVTE